MNQKELIRLFPPEYSIADKILMIPASDFTRLKGILINNARIFILLIEGKISLLVNNVPYTMKSSSFLDLLEGAHLIINETSPDIKAYCLIPNYEFASESLKTLRPGPESYILERLYFPILNLLPEENRILELQMNLFESAFQNKEHYYRQELVQTYFKTFMLEMGNIMFAHDANELKDKSSAFSKKDLVIMEFMKLVWKHYKTEYQLDFYADSLSISTKHLSRLVKEAIGKTPHTIICEELIKHAKDMLNEEGVSVAQIAEELHFADQASFSKFFKKRTKLSPSEYRNQENGG